VRISGFIIVLIVITIKFDAFVTTAIYSTQLELNIFNILHASLAN